MFDKWYRVLFRWEAINLRHVMSWKLMKYQNTRYSTMVLTFCRFCKEVWLGKETFDTYNSYGMSWTSYSKSVKLFYVWICSDGEMTVDYWCTLLFELSSGLQKASQAARIPDRNCVHLLLQVFTFAKAIFPTLNNINWEINHLKKGLGYQQNLMPFLVFISRSNLTLEE